MYNAHIAESICAFILIYFPFQKAHVFAKKTLRKSPYSILTRSLPLQATTQIIFSRLDPRQIYYTLYI